MLAVHTPMNKGSETSPEQVVTGASALPNPIRIVLIEDLREVREGL
ncbi:MAG: hypothetical protein QOH42_2517, partial [Blastocatellia bacterium]|nr:hypothetical protein [Blastocatellia bacterium]